MSDRFDAEYVLALWQGPASRVEHLSLNQLHARAEHLRREFDGTRWVPWTLSIGLALFFGAMLIAAAPRAPQQAGAILGLIAAIVPAVYMVALRRREAARAAGQAGAGAAVSCAEAYRTQLARQRGALTASAVTLVLMMVGAGLLAAPVNGGLRETLGSAAGPALIGLATGGWVWRQARRYARRIQELRRLSG